jgi:hypothetical protein
VGAKMTTPLFKRVDCLSIPVPDIDAEAAGLKLPGSNAELVLHGTDRPMETDPAVDSVPEALARFTSAGGRVLEDPFEILIGLCAVVADPWGNVLVILDASKGHLQVDESRRVIGDQD